MTKEEAKNNINGFTTAQKVEFNIRSNSKIHSIQQTFITQADLDLASDTADYVSTLNDDDLSSLSSNLSNDRKLSGRPC